MYAIPVRGRPRRNWKMVHTNVVITLDPLCPPSPPSDVYAILCACTPKVGVHRPGRPKLTALAAPLAIMSVVVTPIWSAGCFLLKFLPGGAGKGGRRSQVPFFVFVQQFQ